MRPSWLFRSLVGLAVIGLTVSAASADDGAGHFTAHLNGFRESPPKLTGGSGSFSATVDGSSLTYRLTFGGLSTDAFMAHIHFAERGVNGGIFIWLCGSATAPGPAGTPACPAAGGTVTRTVTAADVQTITPDQGVAAGDFAGALRILRSGDAYVNVHTTRFTAGEIRGQVGSAEDES